MHKQKSWIAFSIKLLVPVVLLTIIFSRVDPAEVVSQILGAHAGYFIISIVVGFGLQISGGAWRWRYFLRKVYGIRIPYTWILKHYWTGMFLGYFVPGHLGWDAYRLVAANRRVNAPLVHATVILLEKIVGLLSCFVLIIFSYPFVAGSLTGTGQVQLFLDYLYALALLGLLSALGLLLVKKRSVGLIRWIEEKINSLGSRLFKGFDPSGERDVLLRGLAGLIDPSTAFCLWGSSLFIRSASALGGYLVLRALDQDISVMINFFAVSLMMFMIMVPVSFGGIGVREGVFIVVYGLFGIPATVSLSASYLGLIGLLLTISIGGIIMFWNNLVTERKSGRII